MKKKMKQMALFGLLMVSIMLAAAVLMAVGSLKTPLVVIIPAIAAVLFVASGTGLRILGNQIGALTADRDTPRRAGQQVSLGVATTKKIYAGSLVMRSATGYATPGAIATGCIGVGRAAEYVDNTLGADGAVSVLIDKGVYRFKNSAAGEAIAVSEIGNLCYVVDDETVSKTDNGGTRSIAGRIHDVDSSGVWVEFSVIPRTATVGSADLDPTAIKYATVALTNANIKNLRATPITLVAAQGASKVIEFVSAQLRLDYGSNVFTETADNLAVRYENGAGALASQAIECTGFIDAAADTITNALPKIDAIVAQASMANKAIVLHNTGDGEFGGNAGADTLMVVKVAYRVHDFA
ncbi:MAG: hypothetical protein AABZ15_11800 [Nitrospirota bacterium]